MRLLKLRQALFIPLLQGQQRSQIQPEFEGGRGQFDRFGGMLDRFFDLSLL